MRVSRSVRVPNARFTGSGSLTRRTTASVITAATVSTKVKSRVCVPSPSTVSGRPARAASTKAGTTAA